jgi:hypothetical protein
VKTTIELPEEMFREAKATAARRGIPLRRLFEEALSQMLARNHLPTVGQGRGWPTPRADVPSEEIWRIQRLIDEEFEQIEPGEE